MVETACFSTHLSSHLHHNHRHLHNFSAVTHRHQNPFLSFPKNSHYNLSFSISNSHFSSPSPSSTLKNPLIKGRFLTDEELEKLEFLSNFSYHKELKSGLLWVRVVREEEMDMTVSLLSESFAESMMIASGYVKFMEYLVKNYLTEKREMMPYNATLLAIYRENGEEDFELAGTVELTFDRLGSKMTPPTPTPPRNAPYICNMAVSKPLRRRGIGWNLLKAGEELIAKMSRSRDVYLHCRIIDEGPLDMYTRAGYHVVKTDSILTLFTLQRRRHLMRKKLPENPCVVETSDEELL